MICISTGYPIVPLSTTYTLLLASLSPSLIEDWRRSSSNSSSRHRRSRRQQLRQHRHRHDEVYAVGQSELVNG